MRPLFWWLVFFFVVTLTFYGCYVALLQDWTVMHEQAHVEINKKYGMESVVNMTYRFGVGGLPWSATTRGDRAAGLRLSEEESARVGDLHAMNEIYGYNVVIIIKAVLFAAYLFVLSMGWLFAYFFLERAEVGR